MLPDLAKRHDDVGAKAFVKYWFDVLSFVLESGDVGDLKAVSMEGCKTCSRLEDGIAAAFADGGSLRGRGWTVLGIRAADDRTDGAHVYVFVRQKKQVQVDGSGATTRTTPAKQFGAELLLYWRGSGWKMREMVLL